MIIRDEIKRLPLLLQAHRRLHRAEIIADMKFSAGLETGENAHARSMNPTSSHGQAGKA